MMDHEQFGLHIDAASLGCYFQSLVSRFYKILPLRESEEATLGAYMRSLQMELIGCQRLVSEIGTDPLYLSLMFNLQCLIDDPDCKLEMVRRQVFGAISSCNKLKAKYGDNLDGGVK